MSTWIGFVHVKPHSGSSPLGEGVIGAYTHAIANADSLYEFKSMVFKSLEEMGLFIVEISDVDRFEVYQSEGRIGVELEELVCKLSGESRVAFDIFDGYEAHNA